MKTPKTNVKNNTLFATYLAEIGTMSTIWGAINAS